MQKYLCCIETSTWFNIIENPDTQDKSRREIHTIKTNPKNKLHLSKEDVEEYYLKNKPNAFESWYITPVGNPSGTKMDSKKLIDNCKTILEKNPKAIIILDIVYVRTLIEEEAKDLFSGLAKSPAILNRIVFLDSFSKSHGLCRERLAMYFCYNETLFTELHATNIAFSAGPGVHKDYQMLTLGRASDELNKGISDLHWFWRKERLGLYKFLMSDKFKHLFEREQPHIHMKDFEKPCTLYILIRAKEGVNSQKVLLDTGVLGVDTKLLSGHYIRFAVGTLKGPVFSHYV